MQGNTAQKSCVKNGYVSMMYDNFSNRYAISNLGLVCNSHFWFDMFDLIVNMQDGFGLVI